MKQRETLNFYRSFYEAGKQLTDVERLQFYDAILEKSFEKNVKMKKLNGVADILFTAILPTITSQNRNYLNGLKGVKAKKNNPPKNNKTSPLDNSLTTYKEKEKEKEKEKDKDKDKEKDKDNIEALEKPTKPTTKPIVNNFKKWTAEEFQNEVAKHGEEYSREMKWDFFTYWTEPNPKGKMLFQLKTTWCTSRRLANWSNRGSSK